MSMEHFETHILKLTKKLISRELIEQLNSIFSLFYDIEYI